ncbi:flavodoxin FldA [Cyanobium sp. CH-040]|uniref:flavodoxin FldA n=1 Tax=Cyanobium sp. CH-040 TaxID=2823708 RepID=UPI0020CBD787|nr:flavodoxin FldA [Cyanobium sp. CH-040]MCP9928879.1 flavodoxin FldA [Cyanobium sp. CH-040]
MTLTIFYATSTGKTEDIAQRLAALLGANTDVRDVDSLASAEDFCAVDAMVCCVPTWNTGADSLRSGTAWDTYVEDIADISLAGKPVAILGLGDSSSYGDYFCDAMEELYRAFEAAGARMVGSVPIDGYTFNDSKSVINGRFCGLPIDEDSEPDLTDERLGAWARQLQQDMAGQLG